ncbi:MAG: hypothetical protein HYV26_17950 [Candidatus Hydrogenedentes bacterium]|nr:hypothetical protein [Candidatus Hydrogenedentota bacterium]
MGRHRNPLRQALVSAVAVVFFAIFRRLPLPVARRAGRLFGRVSLALLPRLHRVGRQNLDLAYGDRLSDAEKRRILRGAAENMAIVAAEFPHLPRLASEDIGKFAQLEGVELIDLKRGLLLIGAHLANWEWMGAILVRHGIRTAVVVRPLDAPRLNTMVDATRRACGVHTIGKDDAGVEMVRLLKEGWLVGVLIDQSPRDNAVPAKFLGADCWATIAPVMIAVRAKVPVHPVSIVREADGTYTLRMLPALELARTGDLRRDLIENTQRCQSAIEATVREHPELWLWFHRRWKPRPRLAAEWQARLARDEKRRSS